jgi:hypothetical protein
MRTHRVNSHVCTNTSCIAYAQHSMLATLLLHNRMQADTLQYIAATPGSAALFQTLHRGCDAPTATANSTAAQSALLAELAASGDAPLTSVWRVIDAANTTVISSPEDPQAQFLRYFQCGKLQSVSRGHGWPWICAPLLSTAHGRCATSRSSAAYIEVLHKYAINICKVQVQSSLQGCSTERA